MEVVHSSLAGADLFQGLFAYIDPGTGSMIFQVLAATLISAGLLFKGMRHRMMMLFYTIFRSPKTDANCPTEFAPEATESKETAAPARRAA